MSELIEVAILAYRNGRYHDSIELLLQETDTPGEESWMARLYLGMAYQKVGRVADAHRMFKRLMTDCPDDHIRSKAESVLPLVEAEMRRRFQKETTRPEPAYRQNSPVEEEFADDLQVIKSNY